MSFPQDKNGRSKAVKIDEGLEKALNDFLQTERARELGYKYKVDVVNAAVRALLEKYHFEYQSEGENDLKLKNGEQHH